MLHTLDFFWGCPNASASREDSTCMRSSRVKKEASRERERKRKEGKKERERPNQDSLGLARGKTRSYRLLAQRSEVLCIQHPHTYISETRGKETGTYNTWKERVCTTFFTKKRAPRCWEVSFKENTRRKGRTRQVRDIKYLEYRISLSLGVFTCSIFLRSWACLHFSFGRKSFFLGGGGVTVWRDSFIKGVVEVEVGIRKPEVGIRKPEVGWVSDYPVFLGRRKEVRNFCKNKWTWYIYWKLFFVRNKGLGHAILLINRGGDRS